MNCTQIEKLLPLYAGHDLSGGREQAVVTHLQACTTCTALVADYREARELVRGLTPPAVSDDVYSEIRNGVWHRIEAEARPSLFQPMAVWFRPQFALTTAVAALLITVSAVGIYLVAKRSTTRPEVIAEKPKDVIQQENDPGERLVSGPFLTRPEEILSPRRAGMPKRQGKPDHIRAPDRANSVVAYPPDTQVVRTQPSSPIIGKDDLDFAGPDSEKSLRMEIQTKNPNIRIIWFAQRDPKPAVGNAKGI
jgi:hypothetical protein